MDEVDRVDLVFLKFNNVMENTYLVKLSRNYNEIRHHKEYDIRRTNLQRNVTHLRELLKIIDLNTHENSYEIIASLIILCKELSIKSEYNPKKAPDYIKLLHSDFEMKYGVTLDNLLITGEKFDSQLIFDNCMEKIHKKLSPAAFKKYPSLIDVYSLIISDLKTYNVTVSPLKTLPVALILNDDYVDDNKVKGLKSCLTILQCTEDNSFINGNYHEVIYKSLWNAVNDDKIETLKLAFECFNEYLKILPKELKKKKMNDILYNSLYELQIDNVYRKKEYFIFIQSFISIDLLKRQKLFESIIVDNLDQCTMESYRQLLFKDVMQCLQIWIKHCWCAWYFPTSRKLLAVLIKILYVLKNEETDFLKTVEEVIITLIDISEIKHQKEILLQLQGASELNNEIFTERINKIRNKYNLIRECDITFESEKSKDVAVESVKSEDGTFEMGKSKDVITESEMSKNVTFKSGKSKDVSFGSGEYMVVTPESEESKNEAFESGKSKDVSFGSGKSKDVTLESGKSKNVSFEMGNYQDVSFEMGNNQDVPFEMGYQDVGELD